jgi:AhpD family alkylhydroperoxidase
MEIDMSQDWKARADAVMQRGGALYKASPDVVRTFNDLATHATKDGALAKKTKELMAVSISVVTQCEDCIAYHTRAAIKAGAERAEFVEAIGVAIEMGGGPASVYAGKALEAFDALSS